MNIIHSEIQFDIKILEKQIMIFYHRQYNLMVLR